MHVGKLFILLSISAITLCSSFVDAARASATAAACAAQTPAKATISAAAASAATVVPEMLKLSVVRWVKSKDPKYKHDKYFITRTVKIPKGASLEKAKEMIGYTFWFGTQEFNLYPAFLASNLNSATSLGAHPFKSDSCEVQPCLTDLSKINPRQGVCAFTPDEASAIPGWKATIIAKERAAKAHAAAVARAQAEGKAPAAAAISNAK